MMLYQMNLAESFAELKSRDIENAVSRIVARMKSQTRESGCDMTEIQIPFPGFYSTRFGDIIDSYQEREFETLTESQNYIRRGKPEFAADWVKDDFPPIPPAFGKQIKIWDMTWRYCSSRESEGKIAAEYAEEFWQEICREFEIPEIWQGIEFSILSSPREYNFETDRIFARVSDKALRIIRKVAESDPDIFSSVIQKRHKSCDGFISHYSWHSEDWQKPNSEMDHNELETVLRAAMKIRGVRIQDIEDSIWESIAERDYLFCDCSIDWNGLKEAYREEFAETISAGLRDAIESGDSEFAARNLGLLNETETAEFLGTLEPEEVAELETAKEAIYRCNQTRDMFN